MDAPEAVTLGGVVEKVAVGGPGRSKVVLRTVSDRNPSFAWRKAVFDNSRDEDLSSRTVFTGVKRDPSIIRRESDFVYPDARRKVAEVLEFPRPHILQVKRRVTSGRDISQNSRVVRTPIAC